MASDFAVYCIKSVSSPPQAMSRRKESGEFYCHIDVPIPEQLVVFSEGQWQDRKDFDVILRYKDDEIQLGHISSSNSCLCWRRDSSMPASMVCKSEKGLAKLVLEKSTGPPVLVRMTTEQVADRSLQVQDDNTPQIKEENCSPNTANRGQKNKRRSSLGKDNKTQNGPNAKKQKLQNSKTITRVRNPKSESQSKTDSQENKEDSVREDEAEEVTAAEVKSEIATKKKARKGRKADVKDENKSKDSKVGVKDENKCKEGKAVVKEEDKSKEETNEKVKKYTKVDVNKSKEGKAVAKEKSKEETNEKVKKDTKVSAKVDVKEKKGKREKIGVKQDNIESDSVKEKKSRKDSKTEVKGSPSEPLNEKKTRKGSKSESKGRPEIKIENDENKIDTGTESPPVVDSDGAQSKKRGRKSKKDQVKEEKLDADKCDKENVDINIPVLSTEVQKQIIAFSNSNTTQNVTNEQMETSQHLGTKKMAVCKDLTSRALARPTGRWGHSLCFIHRNLSLLIGGQGEKQQLNKDSVWTLDTETRRWKSTTTQSEGQKPEYRMGHTATYDPMVRCIYVFGGSKNTRWFHDVHVLDIDEWKWQLVKVNGKAPTRAYHSATLYRHELWIFGGVYPRPDPQPDGCSNDIHIFSPVMESWYSPIVKGEKPIPRSGHSATLLNDQLVVFGGWDAPISYSDLHILDMSIVEWSQPEFTGTPPSPRSWHASCALTGNRLLIHGGYNGDFALDDTHIFNLDNMAWCQIEIESKPTARVGHKALCMPYRHDNEEEDEVIIFGGGDNDGEYFEDLMSIYVPFDPVPLSSS